jgi:PAS domain S-box-containing protein
VAGKKDEDCRQVVYPPPAAPKVYAPWRATRAGDPARWNATGVAAYILKLENNMSGNNLQKGFTSPGRDHSVSKSFYFGLFTMAAGLLVLVGWLFDIPTLKSVLPWFVTMKANTAAGFVLAGLSLTLLARDNPSAFELRMSQISACVTALLGFLTICQYLFGLNLGIDQLLFTEQANAVGTLSPGRMAPNTAINFLLLGCALFIVNFRRGIPVAQGLVLLTGLAGLLPLIGYLYGATAFIGIGHYTQMAIHTAVLFTVASIGVLALHPADGIMRTITGHTMGGWLLRHLLPLLIGVPIVLGWFRVQGERYGYFESAFGVALMMVCMMILLTGLIWWAVRDLNRREESLRSKDYFLSESQRLGHVGSWYYDLHGPFKWSEEMYHLYGVSPDTFTPTPELLFSLIHPDDRPSMQAWLTTCAAGIKHELVFRIIRPDGALRFILGRGESFHDAGNRLIHMAGTVQDITERKLAEEALRESGRFAQATVDALSAHIAVLDETGTVIAVNRAWRDFAEANGPVLSNVNEGANCLSVCDAARGPYSEEAAIVATGIRDVISGARSEFKIEYPCHSPDTKRWFVCRVSRFSGLGAPRIVFAHEDITERRLLEEENMKIEEKNRQLQKSESLGRMAGSIAHHFNNQLSVVQGYLEMVIGDLPPNDSRAVKLAKAMQAAGEASEISGLLLFYLGQQEGKLELLDLSELCRRTIPVIQAGMPENVVLETDLPSPGPCVSADAEQIQQILANLIINACEAIGNGAGLVHLSVKTVSPTDIPASHRPVEWSPKDRFYACLEVKDSGCGIREEDMDKVFDPFYTTKFIGRGLGLSVVLGIVKTHNAAITAESGINGGSAFKVFFPLSVQTASSPDGLVFPPPI